MTEPSFEAVEPNVVLRGGPLDGEQVHLASRAPIGIEVGDERCVYRPTRDTDSEFQRLTVWVFDHGETA